MEEISWNDFEKVDMRVGKILNVADFPKARKPAYQLTIDFGDELGIKQSSAQITVHYSKEELLGKQIVAIVNFPKKQIANFFSECLVTGFADDNGDVILTTVEKKVPNGAKLM
ncbi:MULTISPECIES: tRNA-binding protein [unclassified Sphingobacterium]|uniref:tRNA-binding protein n=1 Tax=unclassified Sphingobacterium TaxID=2609468 RepID=UPI00104CF011|nr:MULTISPECIES: tRNA-binding protein [unclassified Sphingobacterium]MCS3555121.1 tRNA-binding protein [Sphingobacterium sp. JUb21]TCR03732.1 tRNA-binding protein [Sphingobacterium sp. JUb20]